MVSRRVGSEAMKLKRQEELLKASDVRNLGTTSIFRRAKKRKRDGEERKHLLSC